MMEGLHGPRNLAPWPKRKRAGRIAAPALSVFAIRSLSEQLGHRRASALLFDFAGVEANHRLVADDMGLVGAEAVELGPHRAAIGAEHPDLDEIAGLDVGGPRSEEHTSELQSLMRISY